MKSEYGVELKINGQIRVVPCDNADEQSLLWSFGEICNRSDDKPVQEVDCEIAEKAIAVIANSRIEHSAPEFVRMANLYAKHLRDAHKGITKT
jgi:endonuclease V-like protein UPF0215 family